MSFVLEIKEKIANACHLLHSIGLVCGASGNISIRVDDKVFLTPSGRHKALISPQEIVTVGIDGKVLDGGKPTSELPMHLAIYRNCKEINAIVHAHPPWTLSVNLSGKELDPNLLVETSLFLKRIPVIQYFPPGSKELAEAVASVAPNACTIILSKHGAVSYAQSLEKAIEYMEYLEHLAKVHVLTNIMK